MKRKKLKEYTYDGLGFPVKLLNVEMVMIDGEWHPKINVEKVADDAIRKLAMQKERITGKQLKFIRTYFSMSLRGFAKEVVNESHTAVSKWEKFGNKVTNMDINIEKIIRLYISAMVNKKMDSGFLIDFFENYDWANISTSQASKKYLEIRTAA